MSKLKGIENRRTRIYALLVDGWKIAQIAEDIGLTAFGIAKLWFRYRRQLIKEGKLGEGDTMAHLRLLAIREKCLALYFLDGLTQRKIGALVGCCEPTVNKALHLDEELSGSGGILVSIPLGAGVKNVLRKYVEPGLWVLRAGDIKGKFAVLVPYPHSDNSRYSHRVAWKLIRGIVQVERVFVERVDND